MPPSTGDRIAVIAHDLLVSEGSAAVTMRRVATAAGLTAMAIYRHFPNRESLLESVAETSFAELARAWGERDWSTDYQVQLDEALDAYLDFALERPHLYAFLFTEQRLGARRFPDEASASPTLSVLADALTSGMRAGILRQDDVWELSLVISATLHGLVQLRAGGRLALPDDDFRALCRTALGRVLDGVRA
ncbi:TetR/AcrR family transcriptional regulator [Umezawaea sp. Da 62-37]|uniref:TetR/AcrR family transcriptional regulator n=1 Tax=Umezawaea sp. Da 62-37 TaxID=3075927 RepID=UPI0028F72E1D|nr:TetR/AcrR family transcriptional regulator [Umezawaea sp. Da 62-37]WNV89071.1 TetR/AcrR family transcriptional regulator [Umezawaea sp. Da 62-37]